MKKIIFYIMTVTFFASACNVNELDNYDAPNSEIYGTIIDNETGEAVPLPVQGSTGVKISLMEKGTDATKPVDFYAHYDGTYRNMMVFGCDYDITIDNGPFTDPVKVSASVSGKTQYDIKVTPLSRITINASASGKTVTVSYVVTPALPGANVTDVYGYWNFAPGVDDGTANKAGSRTSKNLSGSFTFNLAEDSQYTANLHKIQSNNNTVYVRVGARISGKINYSVIVPVVVN